MKNIILSMLLAAFITILIPLAIVEVTAPNKNADSTAPQPTVTDAAEQI